MKCLINRKIHCFQNVKKGKGKLNVKYSCQNCTIFLKAKQTPLGVIEMGKKKTEKWIEKRLKEAKEKREAQRKEAGIRDLLRLAVGETEITIDPSVLPREVETKYGDREVLKATVEGTEYDYMINPNSPLYLEILERLAEGENTFIIVRSGTGKQTRYSLKE